MSKIEDALRKSRAVGGAAVHGAPFTGPVSSHSVRVRASAMRDPALQIAQIREDPRLSSGELEQRRMIQPDSPDNRAADAFRHLRTGLLQKSGGKNFVLMVTSVIEDGGASFVAANLGAAIAFDEGKTALVIDCNLRSAGIERHLSIGENKTGLTDFLIGSETKVENLIHGSGIPRLRVIPAGTQEESSKEFFSAPQLRQLLLELRGRYPERYIIIDAPPITESADARMLEDLCDHVVLVVPYGRVTDAQVLAAARTIGRERFLGCVFNGEPRPPVLYKKRRA